MAGELFAFLFYSSYLEGGCLWVGAEILSVLVQLLTYPWPLTGVKFRAKGRLEILVV